jgi:hypothetical protein
VNKQGSYARGILLLLATLISLNACGQPIDEAVFTEEVKLHDGRMIKVDRKNRRMHSGFPERRGRYVDYELRYAPLGLTWKGSVELQPMSFELFSGVPYVAFYARKKDKCSNSYPEHFAATLMKWATAHALRFRGALIR